LPHEGAFGGVATTTLLNYKAVTIEMEMTAKKKVQLMCVVVKTKGITSVGNDAAKKIDNGNFFGW